MNDEKEKDEREEEEGGRVVTFTGTMSLTKYSGVH